jgi:hypothetical protein
MRRLKAAMDGLPEDATPWDAFAVLEAYAKETCGDAAGSEAPEHLCGRIRDEVLPDLDPPPGVCPSGRMITKNYLESGVKGWGSPRPQDDDEKADGTFAVEWEKNRQPIYKIYEKRSAFDLVPAGLRLDILEQRDIYRSMRAELLVRLKAHIDATSSLRTAETAILPIPIVVVPAEAPLAASGKSKRARDPQLTEIIKLARQMTDEGLTHQEICNRMGDYPRPPAAGWRNLKWPQAYLQKPAAVKKWLSKNSPRRQVTQLP